MFRSETMPEGVTPYSAMFQPTKDGHRFFLCRNKLDGLLVLAVADDSGQLPEHTEDGVLVVDPTRLMTVQNDSRTGEFYVVLPLYRPGGIAHVSTSTCAITPRDAMFVSGMLGMPLPTIYQEVQG